jgi:hypothetical protein
VMKEIEGQRDLVRRVLHMISWEGHSLLLCASTWPDGYQPSPLPIRMTAKPSPNLHDSQDPFNRDLDRSSPPSADA